MSFMANRAIDDLIVNQKIIASPVVDCVNVVAWKDLTLDLQFSNYLVLFHGIIYSDKAIELLV